MSQKAYLKNRWLTEEGQLIVPKIVERLKKGQKLRPVLKKVSFIEDSIYSDLRGIDFSHLKLENVVLEDMDLSYTSFHSSLLTNVRFYRCDFHYSDLRSSQFINARLSNARFVNCDLQSVHFTDTYLLETLFQESIAEKSQFTRCQWMYSQAIDCNFQQMHFQDGVIKGLIENTDFSRNHFDNVTFKNAQLKNSNFEQATFNRTILHKVTAIDTDLNKEGIIFIGQQVQGETATKFKKRWEERKWRKVKQRLLKYLEENSEKNFSRLLKSFPQNEAANTPYLDCRGINLSGLELTNIGLESIDFSYASFKDTALKNCQFRDCLLFQTDFTATHLEQCKLLQNKAKAASFNATTIINCKFEENDLNSVNFRNSRITGSIFSRDDFSSVDFYSSIFNQFLFTNANGPNADFSRSSLLTGAFKNCKFTDGDFEATNFEAVYFQDVNLSKTNFEIASLYNCNFGNSELEEANFDSAVLHYADLRNTRWKNPDNTSDDSLSSTKPNDLEKIKQRWQTEKGKQVLEKILHLMSIPDSDYETHELVQNQLIRLTNHSDFGKIHYYWDLRGVDLNGRQFNNMYFEYVDLSWANLHDCHFENCKFNNTKLVGTSFAAASLSYCNLHQVIANGSTWQQATINNTAFEQVHLKEVDLSKVTVFKTQFQSVFGDNTNLSQAIIANTRLDIVRMGGYKNLTSELQELAPEDDRWLDFQGCFIKNTEINLYGKWGNVLGASLEIQPDLSNQIIYKLIQNDLKNLFKVSSKQLHSINIPTPQITKGQDVTIDLIVKVPFSDDLVTLPEVKAVATVVPRSSQDTAYEFLITQPQTIVVDEVTYQLEYESRFRMEVGE